MKWWFRITSSKTSGAKESSGTGIGPLASDDAEDASVLNAMRAARRMDDQCGRGSAGGRTGNVRASLYATLMSLDSTFTSMERTLKDDDKIQKPAHQQRSSVHINMKVLAHTHPSVLPVVPASAASAVEVRGAAPRAPELTSSEGWSECFRLNRTRCAPIASHVWSSAAHTSYICINTNITAYLLA
jgi:hypothetical protein